MTCKTAMGSEQNERADAARWRLVHDRSPAPGQWVEIGRIPRGGDTVQPLDKVWWYPMNWNLEGMWWRDAVILPSSQA